MEHKAKLRLAMTTNDATLFVLGCRATVGDHVAVLR